MKRLSTSMDRRALFATGAAAALLAASGVSAGGAPRRGGRLRLALSGAQRSDDWCQGDGLFMQVARQGLIFDSLTEIAADGTLRAELAISWKRNADGREWTFDLRRDVEFHDGAPLTARDVVASLDAAMGHRADISATTDHQVSIVLAAPTPGLPIELSQHRYVIRPAHAMQAGIGTGLYRLRRFTAGQQVLSERVARHFKDGLAGWFDEVELMSVPAEQVRVEAVREYMADAVDLAESTAITDMTDMVLLPSGRRATLAASRDIAQPVRIGTQYPMDNLRASERWWFA